MGWGVVYISHLTMHQSIPAAPSAPSPQAHPRALAFLFTLYGQEPAPGMANSRGRGLLSCQIPWGGDEKRGQMPRPVSTLQHFSSIARLSRAILSILMCDFLFQLTSSFVIVLF